MEAIEKLIADSPDRKLAKVCEVLLDGLNRVLNISKVHDHEYTEDAVKQALQRANEIAGGGE